MGSWTAEQLQDLAASDDLHIAPYRSDGSTIGTPTWVWSVVVGSDLYVRAYNGTESRWYQAARQQRAGQIQVAIAGSDDDIDVSFEPLDSSSDVHTDIDTAYRQKYADSSYLPPMVSARTRAATVRITPRNP